MDEEQLTEEEKQHLLFYEMDSALCHLLTLVEANGLGNLKDKSEYFCASVHIMHLKEMAEEVGEELDAWKMTRRIEGK